MIYSSTILNTESGDFKVNYHEFKFGDCLTLVKGEIDSDTPIFVRMQSSCLFSQSFHTIDCDCSKQLISSMEEIARLGRGVVVYLDQEGRGIGLKNKIKSMEYERVHKVDTSEAFKALGYDKLDYRDYTVAVESLKEIGCKKIRIASNDPQKIKFLEDSGFEIVSREKLHHKTNEHIDRYLDTKKKKLGHLL